MEKKKKNPELPGQKKPLFLGLTGNTACWFIPKTSALRRAGVISSVFFLFPPFLESGFEVTAPWFEREKESTSFGDF